MGDIRLIKPDCEFSVDLAGLILIYTTTVLFARQNRNGPEFVLEAFGSQYSDPGDIPLKEAFTERSLSKIANRKSKQDFLDDVVFYMSNIKLPADASPNQRVQAMKKLLGDKETKLRFIFSIWPRPDSVQYKDMTPSNTFMAKMTPNGNQFWAATLFDFYFVQRYHDQPERQSISTASKLAKWAKANEEMSDQIKVALEWAEDEKDPEIIEPYDLQLTIREWDELMREHIIANQMDEDEDDQGEKELQPDRWALPEQVNRIDHRKCPADHDL